MSTANVPVSVQSKTTVAKRATGRPMKYKSERHLKRALNTYFTECDQQERPYTVQGMALSLGISRETLLQYGKNDAFSAIVKEAKERIQLQWEERLARDKGNVAGTIFWLKNNAGYRDKTESEVVNTHLHLHGVAKASYQEADKIQHKVDDR